MKNAPQLKNSLALRLLKVVFSIYLGITVVITLVQMVNEYLLEAHFVKDSLIISQSIFQESLGTSLWNFDHQQLSVTVEGILKQQTVIGVEIVDDQNKVLIQKGQILNKNAMPVRIEQGIQKPLAYLSLFPHHFNLWHDKKPIGKVTLYSSNQVVIDKVKYNFLVIIINAIIKTIALWLLFIWAFKKYLTKQLDVFCLAMEKIDLDNQKTCFIHLETFDTYELSRIEYFFNALLKRLLEGRDKLNDLNKTLEHKVVLRTQELSDKNLQLEKLNQEKTEFLSIAAHDLKNPLSAISSLTKLIKKLVQSGDNQEKLLNYVHFIDISATRMFELINNLLDVDKIETGNIAIKWGETDIFKVVEDLMPIHQQHAQAKDIVLSLQAVDVPYFANTDKFLLSQVLDNLISNAIKYSPVNHAVTICLSKTAHKVKIAVQNQGQGLSDTDKEKLFVKFNRLSNKPTANEHSTGLGLYIAQKLAKMLNSKIECESVVEQGAVFSLELSV